MVQGLTIVTKDSDFHQRSFLFGHPPKVISVHCDNASTSVIERLLRGRHIDLIQFSTNAEGALLIIEEPQPLPKRTALSTQHTSEHAIRISGGDDRHRLAIGTRCELPPDRTSAETGGNVE